MGNCSGSSGKRFDEEFGELNLGNVDPLMHDDDPYVSKLLTDDRDIDTKVVLKREEKRYSKRLFTENSIVENRKKINVEKEELGRIKQMLHLTRLNRQLINRNISRVRNVEAVKGIRNRSLLRERIKRLRNSSPDESVDPPQKNEDISSGEVEEGNKFVTPTQKKNTSKIDVSLFGTELEGISSGEDEEDENDTEPVTADGNEVNDTANAPPPPPGVISDDIFTAPAPAPAPPPGFLAVFGEPSTPLTPPPVLPSKKFETMNIRVGLIPRKRLKNSIYKTDRLLQKGTKKWGSRIKQVLERKFQKKTVGEDSLNPEVRERMKSRKKDADCVPLLNSSKSLNSAIGCSKIEKKNEILEKIKVSDKWLYTTPEGFEVVARITQIFGIFNDEEKKSLSLQKEEKSKLKLSVSDRFILGLLTEVPFLGKKLKVFEFMESCKSVFDFVKPELEQICSFCNVLMKSEKFRSFLSLVLVITNFLNQTSDEQLKDMKTLTPKSKEKMVKKTKKEVVHYGLSVRSLLNLARVKNPENKSETLMDVIYSIILEDDPSTLGFRKEFIVIKNIVDGSTLNEIKDNFEKFKGSVKKMTTYLKEFERCKEEGKLIEEDQTIPALTCVLEEVNKEVEIMSVILEKTDSRVEEISDAYGHDRDSIQEFFIVLNEFLELFDKTEEKYIRLEKKRKREEKRRKKKEEQMMKKRQRELEENLNTENTPERSNIVSIMSRKMYVENNELKKSGSQISIVIDSSSEEEEESSEEEDGEEDENDSGLRIQITSPFCAQKKWDTLIEEARIRVEKEKKKDDVSKQKWKNLIAKLKSGLD